MNVLTNADSLKQTRLQVTRRYFPALFSLLMMFCGRVLGQWLVAKFHIGFLPPMQSWYSGLMPYPVLLPCQIGIIGLYGKISLDFWRGRGFFVVPKPGLGTFLTRFGALYVISMVVRYAVQMALHPEDRWTGGTIPIFFHIVLASFLLILGSYHKNESRS